MMFIGVYPILTASMIAAGGAFSLLNFQPAMLLFANGAVVLTEKLLIPLLTAALFLMLVSRLLPEVPFTKLAELIRTTLLGAVSAVVAAYSIFITTGGTMTWALIGISKRTSERTYPTKCTANWFFYDRQHVGQLGRYSSGVSVLAGGWLITVDMDSRTRSFNENIDYSIFL